MAGGRSIQRGLRRDRIRLLDEYLECMSRCDWLIADAKGDGPRQAFWLGVRRDYFEGLAGRHEAAAPSRLVALGDGPDIPVGPAPVIVGRDPWCDARLDSIRVSRVHCCLTEHGGEVLVLDLGSVNGIRINGRRVEFGRLAIGDELSIAHVRYRLESSRAKWRTPSRLGVVIPDRSGSPGGRSIAAGRPQGG
jgi:hypothetical protein